VQRTAFFINWPIVPKTEPKSLENLPMFPKEKPGTLMALWSPENGFKNSKEPQPRK